jgi:enoyl-CoA hydratase/carnithine racemase
MWLALKLLASGALEGLLKGLSAALRWLTGDWRNLALAIGWPCLLWSQLLTVPGLKADLADTRASLAAEQAAHLGTVNAFLAASKQAQEDAEANAQRVAREQEIITDAIVTDYRGDLAALRARFDRLRARDAARADPGRADAAGLSSLSHAPGRADAAAGEAGLPAAGELALDDALIASEQALQLQALIDWVNAQSAVRFTPEVPRDE